MPCTVPGKFNHNALQAEFLAAALREAGYGRIVQDKAGFGRIEAG